MYWYLRQYLVVFQKKNCLFTALVGIQNLWILHGKFVVFVTVNLHLLIIGSSPVGQGPLLPPPGLPTSLPCMWKKTTAQWKNKKKTSNMETSWNFSENSLLRRTKSAPDAIMRLTTTEHIFVWLIAGSVKDLLTVSLIEICLQIELNVSLGWQFLWPGSIDVFQMRRCGWISTLSIQ